MHKQFNIMYNVGQTKYLINFHDGISTHEDGSPFFGVRICRNKTELNKCTNDLIQQGYIEKP
jgi:hypothetical protein